MLRPISASALLRQVSPRKMLGSSYYQHQRVNSVREDSPSGPGANSIKRKSDGSVTYVAVVGSNGRTNTVPVPADEERRKKLHEASVELGRVDLLCEKVTGAVKQIYDNPALVDVLLDIKTAVQGLCKVQSMLVSDEIAKMTPPPGSILKRGKKHFGANNGQPRKLG
jgi:hypothetical protein